MEDSLNPNTSQSAQESVTQESGDQQSTAVGSENQTPPESQPAADNESLDDETSSASPARSKKWFIIGGILVIFLAAAVFLGARLLKPPSALAQEGKMGPGLMMKSGGPGGAKSVRINMKPAKEIPQSQPETAGIFVRREDQSIFIGTGNVQMSVKKSNNSASSPGDVSSHYDGPVVEVVINHQTKIYQDVTEMMPPDEAQSGEVSVQQVVKPGSLDDLGQNSMVSVWGEKQGDRFIARVITFR